MILIADSGASKTEWAYVSREDARELRFLSQGYNPNYITCPQIMADILSCKPSELDPYSVSEIYFYGAGVSELRRPLMENTLRSVFPNAGTVFVSDDILASCRALLQDSPGFAAILGTGANSCLYDGHKVAMQVSSCGFILGDEGSGADLGKRLIADFMRRNMPEDVHRLVGEELGMGKDELIDRIYTKPFPNRFCAQYAGFIRANLATSPYFTDLVKAAFGDFFKGIVTHYPDYQKYSFNSVGSVAYHFRDLLHSVAESYGMEMGVVLATPMDGLVRYHLGHPAL